MYAGSVIKSEEEDEEVILVKVLARCRREVRRGERESSKVLSMLDECLLIKGVYLRPRLRSADTPSHTISKFAAYGVPHEHSSLREGKLDRITSVSRPRALWL